ncbi:MAG: hypothetical protein ACU84Q_00045 [Gammaproteobacteria bacterium]
MTEFQRPKFKRQNGVVVLSLMLIVIAAASFVLLKGLNAARNKSSGLDQASTRATLQEAKAALIGYAISYPDISGHVHTKGPGRLPCPDYEYQGATDPIGSADSCSLSASTETGLFPFTTIDTNEMYDGSGARLWYAVSDNHRSNAGGVVNSDTQGTLSVDNLNDIVAVIIAPGSALAGQNRSMNATADQYDISRFLEGQNASRGDSIFTSIRTQTVNDEVITITRAELMKAAENRVLTTVSNALKNYYKDPDGDDISRVDPDCTLIEPQCDNAYPWLAVFTNPVSSDFLSVVGNREGHLPVVADGRPFATTLDFDWDVPTDGTYVSDLTYDLNDNCARSALCVVEAGITTQLPIGDGGATCTWAGMHALNCSTVELIGLVSGDTLEREYIFEFQGVTLTIEPPSATSGRTLNFVLDDSPNPARIPAVTLARIILNDNLLLSSGGTESHGSASLELAPGDEVNQIRFRGINFELEIDNDEVIYPAIATANESVSPGELPAWFFEDEWHHLIVVSYADVERPGDLDDDCTVDPDGSCLTLQWDRDGNKPDNTLTDIRAVAIAAGGDLSGSRPSAVLADYFENQNATAGDGIFARIDGNATFNDQIRVLDPDD